MEKIINNNIRIQFLDERIVRLELRKDDGFCDKNTLFVPDRSLFGNGFADFICDGNTIRFGDYKLLLSENTSSLSGIMLKKNGKTVYSYKKTKNSGELPALNNTPEVFVVADKPRVIIPDGGYSVNRNGEYRIEEDADDIYLLLCGGDAEELRRLYVNLTGRCELVRLSTLGSWNSKYYAYNEESAKQVILDYEKRSIPLDIMVIDTDWRSCNDGWGYDINQKLFPDLKRFIDFAHEHGVEIMFNDHPEPFNGSHILSPEEIAYREKNLQYLMNIGLDIWWYDRNWTTKLISPSENLAHETLGLYLFNDITKNYFRQSTSGDVYRRPVIMGNVVNIFNGEYKGITDTASHRYAIQWTGDIGCTEKSRAQEITNMIKCGNNALPYISADCGGHGGNPDKKAFIRWMQFGALSPIFRPHCTCSEHRFREPWVYDDETTDIVREYYNLRYRLLPIIYQNAFQSYLTGKPIFSGLGWAYRTDDHALRCDNEYMLGDNILICPIVGNDVKIVEKINYVSSVKATYFNGMELTGEPIAHAEYDCLNMVLNHESPEKGVPIYNFSARFEAELQFDSRIELVIRCDDGCTVWIDGERVFVDKTMHGAIDSPLKILEKDIIHNIRIDYFQAGGEACCGLYYREADSGFLSEAYLPKGKWLDAFNGTVYNGEITVNKTYGLREMPLFIRLGALLPVAHDAHNTKEQKWDKLVYDFYPCKDASDSGYLYEDDTETMAYKVGQYKKSGYHAAYNESNNSFEIVLYASRGRFSGNKNFNEREIRFRYHLLPNTSIVTKVTLNDSPIEYEMVKKDATAFPFNVGNATPDGDCIIVKFNADLSKEYRLNFFL